MQIIARFARTVSLAALAVCCLAGNSFALGGPVIIGGDDADDHGFFNGSANQFGWLFIEDGFNQIGPQVTNGNMLAVCLGCNGSTASGAFQSGFDLSVLPGSGWSRTTLTSATDIANFFANTGAVNIADAGIIYMSTDANNVSGGINTTQLTVVNANAAAINSFVAGGGGLFTHDQSTITGGFGWLSTLLPGLIVLPNGPGGCNLGQLNLTPAGQAAFPQLNDTIVSNATPWHSTFAGNLGGLSVLVTGPCSTGDQPVVLGGAQVVIQNQITLTPPMALNVTGTQHTVTATVVDDQNMPVAGVLVTFTVTSGPNAGATGQDTTDANGQATFTYVGSGGPGTDTLQASFVDQSNVTVTSNSVTKTWTDCGNGQIDAGEQCDPPDDETCNNMVDDDGDNLIDCADTQDCAPNQVTCGADCMEVAACERPQSDPASIRFRDGLDELKVHAQFERGPETDALASGFALEILNANGAVYRGAVQAEDLTANASSTVLRFRNPAVRHGNGARGGILKLIIRIKQSKIAFRVTAYEDLSSATLPEMTMQVIVGNSGAALTAEWKPIRNGWRLRRFDF